MDARDFIVKGIEMCKNHRDKPCPINGFRTCTDKCINFCPLYKLSIMVPYYGESMRGVDNFIDIVDKGY